MNTIRPDDLPDFERPPLNELVLSIQFGSLPFKNVHAGLLWERFSGSYPNVEEHPPIEPVFETFGARQPREQQMAVELMPLPETLRYWFISQDGNELVQVQRDRLIHNWRQQKPDDQYPRYEALRQKFEQEIATAAAFFREHDIGDVACNQCEVSYINLITMDHGADAGWRLSDIFTIWREQYSDDYLGEIERGRFNIGYVMRGESGNEPLGRLHLSAQPAFLPLVNRPAMRLDVTARGRPVDQTIPSALKWLDTGRDAAVRAFASITTATMHRVWGRKS